MRGVRGVGGAIGQHRLDGRRERFGAHQAGENGFVADRIGQHEGRALRDLVRVKLGSRGIDPGAHLGGFGASAEP